MSKKPILKIPKMDYDTKQELMIYDYDRKIDNYHRAISLHPHISEITE